MKTLLIDNYDSFTYNLYQMLAEVNGEPPLVIKNDELTWAQIQTLSIDNIVLSPGPGTPEVSTDFGVCSQVLAHASIPILGVCLGHQGIVHHFGGVVKAAPRVMHGRVSAVVHNGNSIFNGVVSPFNVVRYHSLIADNLPPQLEAIAWVENSELIMATAHKHKPIWGVQFHPESICSEFGYAILENFKYLTAGAGRLASRTVSAQVEPARSPDVARQTFVINAKKMEMAVDSAQLYAYFFENAKPAFWLDSSLPDTQARFSYMGDATGPYSELWEYVVAPQKFSVTKNGITHERSALSFFDALDESLSQKVVESDELPFDFCGGYVGYLGYELKAECGYANVAPRNNATRFADGCLLFVDRFAVVDHIENTVYFVALSTHSDANSKRWAQGWLEQCAERLMALSQPVVPQARLSENSGQATKQVSAEPFNTKTADSSQAQPLHSNAQYLEKICAIQAEIIRGETYEACLTNRLTQFTQADPLAIYTVLRRINPAPFSCFLTLHAGTVLCASPEKFLTIDQAGNIETKPIKGTRPRGTSPSEDEALRQELAQSEKDRSENLMIVDLLRNDLGRVAEIASVRVNKLFDVETFASVHQLVSTVSARLAPNASPVSCVRACFPGGSMTGAPKKRTLEILDKLEGAERGVYSGAIGYFSLNSSVSLNIVIRTILLERGVASIGVGGAIVDLSDPAAELEETRVKARALLAAMQIAEQ